MDPAALQQMMGGGAPSQEASSNKGPDRPKANANNLLDGAINFAAETARDVFELFNPISWGSLIFGKGKS